ncbi:MAG: dihydroorotate dehydrogenase electron transfer subunit [Clostridiales bacterium]|jgi:dihydroorotate dehydrogenase electron transfer subunit|nr:dihydroorotate dehydrogenase electron transfer subunit [Clostridiales bacterium]
MPKSVLYTVETRKKLTHDTYELNLSGDTSAITKPGQFVNILLDGLFLRRPLSVCDWDDGTLRLIFKVVGDGTRQLAKVRPGDTLDTLTGLGNGYTLTGRAPILIGGGVGIPPMYALAKAYLRKCVLPRIFLGFRSPDDAFYIDEFRELGCETAAAYGSTLVTDLIRDRQPAYDHYCACGPEPMLKAVAKMCRGVGELSFEARMGCGFGACVGCTCRTLTGNKRICVEGPVMRSDEIDWEAL